VFGKMVECVAGGRSYDRVGREPQGSRRAAACGDVRRRSSVTSLHARSWAAWKVGRWSS
jgi:hypothetical protein